MSRELKKKVSQYYTDKIMTHGATSRGVDWNSLESQELRFKQLLRLCENNQLGFTINDLGCGYGSLYGFMQNDTSEFEYIGYDLSEKMIDEANSLYPDAKNARFIVGDQLKPADYTVASGIFNVRMDTPVELWEAYIFETLAAMDKNSHKGFAFNMLTSYSDAEYMQDYLYYANPARFFDYCKQQFSKNVALLHDYDLYEFTLLIKKNS